MLRTRPLIWASSSQILPKQHSRNPGRQGGSVLPACVRRAISARFHLQAGGGPGRNGSGAGAWIRDLIPLRPSLVVGGRTFHNWNTSEEGFYDVRQALMRSTNTWFYQAGLATGGRAILDTARGFEPGRGGRPSRWTMWLRAISRRRSSETGRIANLSIGQGPTLVSPLQMALVMAGLANSGARPPRRPLGRAGSRQTGRSCPPWQRGCGAHP